MKKFYLTALAGLLVACTQNSPNIIKQPNFDESSQAVTNAPVITMTQFGNPDGRTLVLIPGLASGPEIWDNIISGVSDYDVRLVHVAGFSGAPAVKADRDIMQNIAAALITELQTNPAKDPILMGHSMGGFIALKSALLAPDAVSEIVIIDSLPYLAAMFMPGMTPKQAASSAAVMRKQMESMPRGAFDAQQLSSLARLAKNKASHSVIKTAMAQSDQKMVARSMAALLSSDLRDDIADIAQPITVFMPYDPAMGVSKDTVLSLYEEQYQAAPSAKIIAIDGSFHFIMYDKPDALRASIKDVLEP